VPARIVNLRTVHQAGGLAQIDGGTFVPSGGTPLKSTRRILAAGQTGALDAAVYDRAAMGEGFAFSGPAIVEQADTTTLVEPGWTGTVDAAGNLLLAWQGA
jgi:N-methylhydantoinase A